MILVGWRSMRPESITVKPECGLPKQLLSDIGYPSEWMSETLQIVGVHHGREEENAETGVMEYYIRRADHLSRNCILCEAADSCKWSDEERNQTIIW